MDASIKRKAIAGTVAALAVGGTGAGIAATKLGSNPSAESKASSTRGEQPGVSEPQHCSQAAYRPVDGLGNAALTKDMAPS